MHCQTCIYFAGKSEDFLDGCCLQEKIKGSTYIVHISDANNIGGTFRVSKYFGCIFHEEIINGCKTCQEE